MNVYKEEGARGVRRVSTFVGLHKRWNITIRYLVYNSHYIMKERKHGRSMESMLMDWRNKRMRSMENEL